MLSLVGFINLFFWLLAAGYFFLKRWLPFYHPMTFYLCYHFLGFVARPFVASLPDANVIWSYIGFEPNSGNLFFSCLATNLALFAISLGATIGAKHHEVEPRMPEHSFVIGRKGMFILVAL